MGLVVSRVCQDSSAESDPPRRSSKTASVRKPPETADTAEVWDREEPGDGVRSKKSIVLLGVFLYRLHFCYIVHFFLFLDVVVKYSGMVVMVVNNHLVVCCRAIPRCNPHRQGQLLLEAFRRYEHNDEGEDGYGWSRENVLEM